SLRRGVASVAPRAEAVIVALADQPNIQPDIVRRLIDAWRASGQVIVTARYRGVRAPPVLLSREVFDDVAALSGGVGAKAIMNRLPGNVGYVDVDEDVPPDVDSPGDLAALGT